MWGLCFRCRVADANGDVDADGFSFSFASRVSVRQKKKVRDATGLKSVGW